MLVYSFYPLRQEEIPIKGSEKGSVAYLLDRSITAPSQLSDVVSDFGEYSERLRDYLYGIEDIAEEVYAVIADIDEDPTETLNSIEARLDKITKLKRKYGSTIEEILEFGKKAELELDKLDNSDFRLDELNAKEIGVRNLLADKAKLLNAARSKAAIQIEKRFAIR